LRLPSGSQALFTSGEIGAPRAFLATDRRRLPLTSRPPLEMS
jgi:hypothetical protein